MKFPFVLTECAAAEQNLVDFIIDGVENSLGPQSIQNIIRSRMTRTYHKKMLSYYSIIEASMKYNNNIIQQHVAKCSNFKDPLGYYGRIPSSKPN
jgi:hypothetical protein